jgi:carbon starvation protein CstA
MFVINLIDIGFTVTLSIVIAGLLTKQRWAWVMTMIIIGISLLIGILEYFQESPRYINMLIGVIIVFYLNERNVRRVYDPTVKGEGRTA